MKKITRIGLLYFLICFTILFNFETAGAESVAVSFATENQEVVKGDTVAVSLYFDADTDIGDLEAYILYDSDILEFKKGGKYINGGDGVLKLSDDSLADNSATKKYVMEFKAKKIGESQMLLNGKPNVYSYPNSAPMSVSYNSLTVKVKAQAKTSSNANLSSLQISPGKLTPEFKKDVTEYKVEVDESTEQLIVSGKTEDSNAKITLNGNDKLKAGENKVTVTVTAENGTAKKYTINAVKKEAEVKEPDKEPEKEPESNDTAEENTEEITEEVKEEEKEERPPVSAFEVYTEDDIMYIQSGYLYELTELKDETLIPDGFVETKLILYGNSITAYSKSVGQDEFLLLYAKNSEGEPGFYRYDQQEKTLQRYAGADFYDNNVKTVMSSNQYNEKVNQLSLIIAVLSTFMALLVIAVIKLVLKLKGLNDDLD